MAVGSGPVVKAWAEGVPMEPDVWKQVNNLSAVPGVERIAIMPDAHIGNGACVGSAILTRDIVIPAAVGVDIGCFDGDTRVPLLDGSQRCLRELAMSQDAFWVYSVNGSGRIAPGKAVARLTRTNAPLMCVVVSGGDEIVCTPDHQFMLSDGSYREAQALQFNDSLMPLMTAAAHSQHHRHAGRKLDDSDPAFQQARLAGLRRSTADPALQAQRAQIGTRNITAYMRDRPEHFAEVVAANGKRGAAVLDAFNVSPRMCNDCGEQLRNPAALRWHKHREHSFNHKVLSVTPLQRRADVYCLQVEEHHNFALAAGVFVHNCGMIAAPLGLRRSDLSDLQRVRAEIEERVPVGRTDNGQRGDRGAWGTPPQDVLAVWKTVLERDYTAMVKKHPQLEHQFVTNHLGTMGTGNHFLEVCIELDPGDDDPRLWLMLHSGSRGVGNKSVLGSPGRRAQKPNVQASSYPTWSSVFSNAAQRCSRTT